MKQKDSLKNARDSRERVFALLKKADTLVRTDLEQSTRVALQSLEVAKASKTSDLIAASLAMVGSNSLLSHRLAEAKNYYNQAWIIYKKSGDIDAQLEMENGLVTAKLSGGNEKSNLISLHRILQRRTNISIQAAPLASYQSTFFSPRTWKDRILSLIPSPDKMENCQQTQIASIYNSLARGYFLIDEFNKSVSFLELELAICKNLNDRAHSAKTMNSLSAVYTGMGNMDAARKYIEQSLKLNRRLHDESSFAVNLHNLANIYVETGHINLSKRFALRAFRIYQKLKLWKKSSDILIFLSEWELLYGSLSKASTLNARAMRLLYGSPEDSGYLNGLLQQLLIEYKRSPSRSVFLRLVTLHKKAQQQRQIIQYEIAKELARIAQELRLQPEAIRWLKKVHQHEIESKNIEQRNALIGIQMEQALERAARERELDKVKMEKLESELKAKARETELLAIQLAKKGAILTSVENKLAILQSSKNNSSKDMIDAVSNLIQSARYRDKDYELLEKQAKSLYHDFYLSMLAFDPELTDTEKKVCLLLKLGLNSISISHILFTSVRTIESHFFSIRKKLGITGKLKLPEYIRSIEQISSQ